VALYRTVPVFGSGAFSISVTSAFFCFVGILITTILLENRESNTYFSSFYGRRALRIWPVYYLMCATCLVGWLSGKSLALFEGVVPCWTYVLGVQNFWMAKLQDFGAFWLAGTWSLAIEEQFYLIFPLVVRLVPVNVLAKNPDCRHHCLPAGPPRGPPHARSVRLLCASAIPR
jgi:peptidoglycan/LPS O-acetylase OafA/YrhL